MGPTVQAHVRDLERLQSHVHMRRDTRNALKDLINFPQHVNREPHLVRQITAKMALAFESQQERVYVFGGRCSTSASLWGRGLRGFGT